MMRRSVSIAALAVGLLLGGGREAAAYGGYATYSNPCAYSPFGPYYRCNVFFCFCSAYGPAERPAFPAYGPVKRCAPSRPYLLCTADGQCRCSAINPQFFRLWQ